MDRALTFPPSDTPLTPLGNSLKALLEYVIPLTLLITGFFIVGEYLTARLFDGISKRLMDILFTDDRVLYRLVLGPRGTPNYEALTLTLTPNP